MKNKLLNLLKIFICIILFIYVGYTERFNAVQCKVISSQNGIVVVSHPCGKIFKYNGNTEETEITIIFDNKGTINDIKDDTIFKVK